ncbi:unnamed protein product [Angiostrongylus costaricensis]|uniref:Uncharacterized protein n=1 Tax=Angiostrongylus costaricensis TaxID=334426 RepID=A0A0R3PFA7_ANGCS|nr:unnamed protein product [Angiostrongylus costaricensis]
MLFYSISSLGLSDGWAQRSLRVGEGERVGHSPTTIRKAAMLVRSIVLTLFISFLVIDAAVPRLRPAKKAMRNSLVRFGKRADLSDTVFLGESFGPVDTDGLYFERTQPQNYAQFPYY